MNIHIMEVSEEEKKKEVVFLYFKKKFEEIKIKLTNYDKIYESTHPTTSTNSKQDKLKQIHTKAHLIKQSNC